MKKKNLWLGVLILTALVFGMMVVGCEKEEPEYTYEFKNLSSYKVTVMCSDLDPSTFTINACSDFTYEASLYIGTSKKEAIQITYTPTDKVYVDRTILVADKSRSSFCSFYDKQ